MIPPKKNFSKELKNRNLFQMHSDSALTIIILQRKTEQIKLCIL